MRITGEHYFILSLLLSLFFFLLPRPALADGMGGFLELNYNNSRTNTEDESGVNIESETGNFNQLYNLSLNKTFFPNLFLNAGGTYENSATRSSVDEENSESSVTGIRPFIDLTLRNPVFTAGGKYNIRELKSSGSDADQLTTLNENYSAIFGWRPAELPTLDMRFDTTNLYDKDRAIQDTTTDFLSFTLRYIPEYEQLEGLDVRYQPTYTQVNNRIDDVVSTDITHNGRFTYANSFYDRRVSLSTSYNIAHSETEITTSSTTGEILTQLFPFSGLSSIDDTPDQDPLNENSDLIDGNLAASAGINIGRGNTGPRNIGLDFVTPSEVNIINVWTNRELPSQIVNSFSWDIYTSPDNQNWTLFTTVPVASFGPFQNRFEITFLNVTTRYIKVVTSPLSPAEAALAPGFADPDNIFVTEIQAFLSTPASEIGNKVRDSRTNHIYNLDVKTRVMDVPSLFYEFSYYLTKAASSFTNSTLSNGLSVSHNFSSAVTSQARVSREDTVVQDEKGVSYLYSASATARPLPTLSHTLNYSGQLQEQGGERTNTNAIFLNNSAELYKGININLNGGVSFTGKNSGEKTQSTSFSFGSGIVPHRRLTLDLYYSSAGTKQTGGDQDTSDTTERETFGVSYKPFDTVYLLFSFERITTQNDAKDLLNYGANWSPFPDGSLQFTFTYNENLSSDGDKVTLISPNMRWNISRRAFIDLSAQFLESESLTQQSDSVVSSATFRTAL